MDKRKEFIEKMEELFALGEDIIDEFYEECEEEDEIPADEFIEEIENMCFHIDAGLNIFKEI